MAREGKLRLRQNAPFEPIFVRSDPDDLTIRPAKLIEASLSDVEEEE
jgi:hypothetical protein